VLDGEKILTAISARNKVTGDDDDAVFLPWTVGPPDVSVDVAQAVPVEKPGRQGKLLAQFFHPLPDEIAGRNQQHTVEDATEDERAQSQPRFDGFPETHLVTKQKGLGKRVNGALPHLHLMREGL
jgi:hypothetical protein